MPYLKKKLKSDTLPRNLKFGHRENYSSCKIRIFEWKTLRIDLTSEITGLLLLDQICLEIGGLIEKEYFGLRFGVNNRELGWLKGHKSVIKQLKKAKTIDLNFRIKHYPANPGEDLMQNISKYLLYKQLREDLYSEHLIVKGEHISKLIALAIEAEGGEMININNDELFMMITEMKIIPNVSEKTIDSTVKELECISGMDSSDAELEFIKIISHLDSYGIEPCAVLDQHGNKLFLGFNHQGICTFVGDKRTHIFYWENIIKMSAVSKTFMFDLNVENKKRKLGFKFNSKEVVRRFWDWAVDRQNFMTLTRGSEAKKIKSNNSVFRRKVKHQFSGRSHKELVSSYLTLDSVPQPPVVRSQTRINLSRSNSVKAIYPSSIIDANSYAESAATIPRRSSGNKNKSVISIDFKPNLQNMDTNHDNAESSSSIFEESAISCPVVGKKRPESWISSGGGSEILESIEEDIVKQPCNETKNSKLIEMNVEEIIQSVSNTSCVDSALPNHLMSHTLTVEEEDEENQADNSKMYPQIRKRLSQNSQFKQTTMPNGTTNPTQYIIEHNIDCNDTNNNNVLLDNHHPYLSTSSPISSSSSSNDGLFFLKFVVFTTLILLFIMITSLVIYYYYRSATIADINRQKLASGLNKNLDLDSIKRFILRNDDP